LLFSTSQQPNGELIQMKHDCSTRGRCCK